MFGPMQDPGLHRRRLREQAAHESCQCDMALRRRVQTGRCQRCGLPVVFDVPPSPTPRPQQEKKTTGKRKTKATNSKPHKKLYPCGGCGDPTTGSVSKSTGKEYECCPSCSGRVDALNDDHDEDANGDRGPYRERGKFPTCPECGCKDIDQDAMQAGLECCDCGHTWCPPGVYADTPVRRPHAHSCGRAGRETP